MNSCLLVFCVINGERQRALCCTLNEVQLFSQKSTCVIVWVMSWTSGFFFFKCNIIFTWKNKWQTNYGIQSWGFSGHFLKINKINLSLQGNNWQYFLTIIKMWAFKGKLKFWKICNHNCEFHSFSISKHFSEELSGDINKCGFWGLWFLKAATFGRYV